MRLCDFWMKHEDMFGKVNERSIHATSKSLVPQNSAKKLARLVDPSVHCYSEFENGLVIILSPHYDNKLDQLFSYSRDKFLQSHFGKFHEFDLI